MAKPSAPFPVVRRGVFAPRPGRRLLRYVAATLLVGLCLYYLTFIELPPFSTAAGSSRATKIGSGLPAGSHPIDVLVSLAEKDFDDLIAKQSHSVEAAAAAYRECRGRHPPPGFKEWYLFASERNAVIIEDFWDQIYHDIEPFWALPASLIRKEASSYEMVISVRDGQASSGSDWFWTQLWLDLIKTIEHLLPDMDIALNAMDEPRIVVPWEDMQRYMAEAGRTRAMKEAGEVVGEFSKWKSVEQNKNDPAESVRPKNWENALPYWRISRRGCAPDSLARQFPVQTDFSHPPKISNTFAAPHMYHGFVSNMSLASELCHQPDLAGLQGIFVEPLSVSSTRTLFPLFGGSKLSVNNEIILPGAMYWSDEERFTANGERGVPWGQKHDQAIWRGVATGGRNRAENWRAFQRHRFVALNNATKITRAESKTERPENFALPESDYLLRAQTAGKLGDWVEEWSNIGFVDLMCEPNEEAGTCQYTSPHFELVEGVKLADQFNYKYLPDIDGNSFSGRYLGFLRSTSLPIKSTVWREWHDARLVPWKHFVPMDTRFGDWLAIMDYYAGTEDGGGHDEVAERIAIAGRDWAERVLRKEDMQVYVLRVLLEYARVADERRESMGWVEDLPDRSRAWTKQR